MRIFEAKEGDRKTEEQLPVQFPLHSTIRFQFLSIERKFHVSLERSFETFIPSSIKQGGGGRRRKTEHHLAFISSKTYKIHSRIQRNYTFVIKFKSEFLSSSFANILFGLQSFNADLVAKIESRIVTDALVSSNRSKVVQ